MINSRSTLRVNRRSSAKSAASKPLSRYYKRLLALLLPGIILLASTLLFSQTQEPAKAALVPPSNNRLLTMDRTTSFEEKVNPDEKEREVAKTHLSRARAEPDTSQISVSDEYDLVGAELQQVMAGDPDPYLNDPAVQVAQVDPNRYTTDPLKQLAQANGDPELLNRLNPAPANGPTGPVQVSGNYQPATQAVNPVQYHYNGDGHLVGKTENGVRTDFALDIAGELPEVIYTSEGSRYLHLPGVIRAENAEGQVRYLLSDGLGSVRQAMDEQGQVVASYEFDPYGNPVNGSGGEPYGYTGEWWDSDMELLFLRARYYDPTVGRFLAKDPWPGDISRPQTLNSWSYVNNNPANLTDPSGYIDEGQQATNADQIVEDLENIYQIKVLKDWGYVTRPIGYSGPAGSTSCTWQKGNWTMDELEQSLQLGVINLATEMGGPPKFIANIGGVTVSQDYMGGNRGLTWPRRIKFTNSADSIDEWTVIHEFGHAWDANFNWWLSIGLEAFTGGHTDLDEQHWMLPGQCTAAYLPGCNNAGYFYGGIPPAGSDALFDRKEDFAESVVGRVHPDWVQKRAADFRIRALFYPDFTQTPRYQYIEGLMNGTITVR